MKVGFSRQIFEKINVKFHENLSHGGPSFSVRTDGQTDVTKLIDAFSKFSESAYKRRW